MLKLLRETYAEINLDNIAHNVRKIREMVGKDVAIAAVLKANAYGHGAVEIAPTIMENGADLIAVATLTEALELRKHYKAYDILVMGHTPDHALSYLINENIIGTIFTEEQGELLNSLSLELGKKARVHIKYDTGFNRLGFKNYTEGLHAIEKICALPKLSVEGIFSHFALKNSVADEQQFNEFMLLTSKLEDNGINFKYKHICDSIAAAEYPNYRLNMIRPGAILYGLKSYNNDSLVLKQAMQLKSRISHIKTINKGEGVSYGYRWIAERDSIIGTLPFGYADGYPRNLYGKGAVTVNGKKAPIIGVICMDQCMVDLTDCPNARVGDEVIAYGDGSNNSLDIEAIAALSETNKNDIVSRISRRTPRVYIKQDKVCMIKNYLFEGEDYEY